MAGVLVPSFAAVGTAPEPSRAQDVGGLVQGTEAGEDPIAVDPPSTLRDQGDRLGRSDFASAPPRAARISAREGAGLTAIPGVEESDHDVIVEFRDGLARVAVDVRLASRARYPAEVRYRLPRPRGARLTHLSVCIEDRCEDGAPAPAPDRQRYDERLRARPLESEFSVDTDCLRGDRGRPVDPLAGSGSAPRPAHRETSLRRSRSRTRRHRPISFASSREGPAARANPPSHGCFGLREHRGKRFALH